MTEADPSEEIAFLCDPADQGVIAEPVPAKQAMPEWFRKLPPVTASEVSVDDTGLTVKRCMPFLDALATGWIIPLAATVRLEIADGGRTVEAGWRFDRTMVSNHGEHQVRGAPFEPRPPLKFHNFWTIRTPPGWSCLFLPPLNRPHPVFEVLAGVVDTDRYRGLIHFPFIATAPDGLHVIEKGTPIVQVLPFRRTEAALAGTVRAETREESLWREKTHRLTTASEGWYRTEVRAQR
jgi:hypothetical protein